VRLKSDHQGSRVPEEAGYKTVGPFAGRRDQVADQNSLDVTAYQTINPFWVAESRFPLPAATGGLGKQTDKYCPKS
jgi:hypothetical protein